MIASSPNKTISGLNSTAECIYFNFSCYTPCTYLYTGLLGSWAAWAMLGLEMVSNRATMRSSIILLCRYLAESRISFSVSLLSVAISRRNKSKSWFKNSLLCSEYLEMFGISFECKSFVFFFFVSLLKLILTLSLVSHLHQNAATPLHMQMSFECEK